MNRLYGKERAQALGMFVIENNATVRYTAQVFGISKSTVHKDISIKLRYLDPILYKRVKAVLDVNKAQRHLRGGEATKKKYMNMRKRCL